MTRRIVPTYLTTGCLLLQESVPIINELRQDSSLVPVCAYVIGCVCVSVCVCVCGYVIVVCVYVCVSSCDREKD